MSTREPVRLGLVGSGRMARTRAANIAASPHARLIALTSRRPETGRALAAEQGCDYVETVELLLDRHDLDAVVIATQNDSHGPLTTAVLQRGLHALVEYPLALDPRQAADVAALARERRLVVQVGYDQRWLGPHDVLGSLIQQDGTPLAIEIRVAWPGGGRESAFRNVRIGGPPALVKSYYLYAVLDWLGLPSSHDTRLRYGSVTPEGYYDAAVQQAILEYPRTLVHLVWLVGPEVGSRRQVDIAFTWGNHVVRSDGRSVAWLDAAGDTPLAVPSTTWADATGHGLQRFVDAIAGSAAAVDPVAGLALAAATVQLGGHG